VLSTKTQCNLNNAEKYFKEHLQLGDYYSQENIVSGEWAGIGAEHLGLTGKVRQDQFLKLCHNQNPQTGELLTQRMKTTRWDSDKMAEVANRRVFYDFTFSPPKSVSIQALIADDKRLLESHSRAVRIAVNELQHFAGTQVHRGMDKSERLTVCQPVEMTLAKGDQLQLKANAPSLAAVREWCSLFAPEIVFTPASRPTFALAFAA